MSTGKKSILIWSPFISKVGTVQNIINSFYGINKYSNYDANLVNVFGEWDNYLSSLEKERVFIHNFKFLRFIKNRDKTGFLKSRFFYLLIFIFSFFPLLNLIKKQKPNFIIVHLISSIPLTIFNLFNFETKLILHIAGHPKLNFLRKIGWKISSRVIYKVICPSEELKKFFLEKKIFNYNQISVIEDPHIIVKKINEYKKDELHDDFFDDDKILIAIGRMTKQKNYSFLIKNFKNLSLKYTNLKLIIIGDGEEKFILKNLIKKLNIIDKVKLIEYENNVYKYLKKSNYYISTSIWEGSSLAMVDAAYMGVPILCSDCPSGRKEFIGNNQRGFMYKQNDDNDFMQKFINLYELNSNEIEILKINAKKQTSKFTMFKNFLKLHKILN